MGSRAERFLSWVALLAALATIVAGLIEIDRRAGKPPVVAAPPTGIPSPNSGLIPSPRSTGVQSAAPSTSKPTAATLGPITPPIASRAVATTAATPTVTIAPPPTPTPEPVVATPVPVIATGSPSPVTGGGAEPAGMLFILAGIALAIVARRAY